MNRNMRTAIVVLNYNNSSDTIDCIMSIADSSKMPFLLIIVDNASIDNSCEAILRALNDAGKSVLKLRVARPADAENTVCGYVPNEGQIILICAMENRGYAAGNNLGIAVALSLGVDAVWILNNDTCVSSAALEAMEERLTRGGESIGLCGSLVRYHEGAGVVQCCAGGYTNEWTLLSRLVGNGLSVDQARQIPAEKIERSINFVYGASVMVSRTFLERVGLMDERFFLYCEEQDWAWRGRQHGFALGYAHNAEVWHKEGASSGMNRRSRPLRRMLQLTRSRILLAYKHFPFVLPVVAVSCLFAACRIAGRYFAKPWGTR